MHAYRPFTPVCPCSSQLIQALISSQLEFCNSILYNLAIKKIERLQRIQNQAARILTQI